MRDSLLFLGDEPGGAPAISDALSGKLATVVRDPKGGRGHQTEPKHPEAAAGEARGGSKAKPLKPRAPLERGVADELAALGVGLPQPPHMKAAAAVEGGLATAKKPTQAAGGAKKQPPTSGTILLDEHFTC